MNFRKLSYFYVSVLNYAGYDAIGVDTVDLGSKYFIKQDVCEEIKLYAELPKTNVISLEVGEHVPFEKSDAFLDNVCRFGGDIILSWAVPGQAGIGHINCQTNDWVCEQMLKRGYMINGEKSAQLRKSVVDCHCSWFINTLMYFSPCA